jgi:hypothetical protein
MAGMKAGAPAGATLILVVLFFAQGLFFIRSNSPTYDEPMHVAAGYSYLATRDFRIEPQNPPLVKYLAALPLFLGYRMPFTPDPRQWSNGDGYLIGQKLLYESVIPADRLILLSRLPNLLLGGLLVALTGWWCYRLWGNRGAFFGLTLAAFEPNFVAYSSLVTTDVGVTLFIFLSVYLLWEYVRSPTWWLLTASGISTGMALLTKFSAIVLIPILAVIIAACLLIDRESPLLPVKKNPGQPPHTVLQGAAVFGFILFFASLTISPGYLFQGLEPWLFGLLRFLMLSRHGQPAYFMGEHSYEGWWSYFAIAFLIKTPVGTLILIAASLVFWRIGSALRPREAIFLLLPPALILMVMTQAKVNIGLRHILPVYPFLFVVASRLASVRSVRHSLPPILLAIPLSLTALSSLRIAPHQLAYFNELIGGPEEGYRYLSESNIDWGQDLKGVKAYMEAEKLPMIYLSYFGTAPPSYYGIRYQYVPGSWPLQWPPPHDRVPAAEPRKLLAISVTNLQDVFTAHAPLFPWLWVRKPIAKIGYSIFIYDLANDPSGLAKLEETYVKAGMRLP